MVCLGFSNVGTVLAALWRLAAVFITRVLSRLLLRVAACVVVKLPPVGCAPDAYKLFVGNIPKSYTEEELRPVRCNRVDHPSS
jgi:hypothetical protein